MRGDAFLCGARESRRLVSSSVLVETRDGPKRTASANDLSRFHGLVDGRVLLPRVLGSDARESVHPITQPRCLRRSQDERFTGTFWHPCNGGANLKDAIEVVSSARPLLALGEADGLVTPTCFYYCLYPHIRTSPEAFLASDKGVSFLWGLQ